jgi:hypothetical protein
LALSHVSQDFVGSKPASQVHVLGALQLPCPKQTFPPGPRSQYGVQLPAPGPVVLPGTHMKLAPQQCPPSTPGVV